MSTDILVVDDNQRVFESLKPNFAHFGMRAIYAANGNEAEQQILAYRIDAVLLDIKIEEESGIDILRRLKELRPNVPVIMITGFGSIDTAVESMKIGAFDYVKKPLNFDCLFKIVENAVEMHHLTHENAFLKRRIQELSPQVCVENPAMLAVIEQAAKLARTDIPA